MFSFLTSVQFQIDTQSMSTIINYFMWYYHAATPPPRPVEPFLVSCNIDANLAEAFVFCAATVGDSRVNVDSCVLDFNPEALPSELCKPLALILAEFFFIFFMIDESRYLPFFFVSNI